MKFRKLIISLLGTALLTSSVGLSTTTASADTLDDSQNTTEVQPKNLKWAYPFKANKKNGVRPMYNAQTFGITNYMRSTFMMVGILVFQKLGILTYMQFIKVLLKRLLMATALAGSSGLLVLIITLKFTKKALIRKKTFMLRLVKRLN